MAWSDFFLPSGSQSSEEAAANYARLQQLLAEQTAAREEAGTISPEEADQNRELVTAELNSQNAAAAIGALQGGTELFYNPVAWWQDTQEGASIAATAAGDAVRSASTLGWDSIKKVLAILPLTFWILLAVAIFVWIGGVPLVLGWSRGRLAK